MHNQLRFAVSVVALAFIFSFSFVSAANAATFTVNSAGNSNDAAPGNGMCADSNGFCTLRAAVQETNALSGRDTINFGTTFDGVSISTDGQEIVITGDLTINGQGADRSEINGGGASRIFYIDHANVRLTRLKLTGGNGVGAVSSGSGGAIFSDGGSLELDFMFISSSKVAGIGGGVYLSFGTTYCITNTAFINNAAYGNCGGLYVTGGTLGIANTTFSGNITSGVGGGLCNGGTTTLRNVTIADNTANNSSGGIYAESGTLDLGNTLLAANNSQLYPDIHNDNGGIVFSAGFNLVGNTNGVPAGTFAAPGDITNTNPLIAALNFNGGTTPTHALQSGSAARDAGSNNLAVSPCDGIALVNDQRGTGYPRIYNNRVDIGAYELQMITAADVLVTGRVTANGRPVARARVSITDSMGETRSTQTNAFGYYRMANVTAGETFVFTVFAKKYNFDPQVVFVTDDVPALNFVALPQ